MALGRVAAVSVVVVLAGAFGPASDTGSGQAPPNPPALLCKLPPKATKLPAGARHGLVQHLRQYPVLELATPRERARARHVQEQLVSAARRGRWRDLRAVARAGYDIRTAPRKAGDWTIHYFHAERTRSRARSS
jgi:hypothetical protein